MNDDSVSGVVNAVIASVLDVDDAKVLPDARLREELGADEGDMWALALALEDELDVGFGGVEYASVMDWITVADVVSYCEAAWRAQRA